MPLNLKDTFITPDDEIILYPKEGKEHRTAYGGRKKYRWNCDCPKDKYANGKCDNYKKCNKFECFWDGHDCDDIQPLSAYYIDKRASYHQRNRFKFEDLVLSSNILFTLARLLIHISNLGFS